MLASPDLPMVDPEVITQIAANSSLARVSWRDRGKAPLGYIKGMAVMFAVVLRKLVQGNSAALEMARAASSDSGRDALAYYESRFAALGMRNDVSGVDTLRHLFVLLIGLGMRESSGRYCEGRDMSASNVSANSAEAGLFQMSWDAYSASPEIPRLLAEYQANGGGYRAIFAEGVTSSERDFATYGSGTGATFQRLVKECPGLAVETAAVGLRTIRQHWGPINRREAELRPEADEMLLQVQRATMGMTTGADREEQRGTLWVQQSLNKLGADPRLDEDGVAGRNTKAAVLQFQRENGLTETGVADSSTVAAIERKLSLRPGEELPSGPTDIAAWLERLVTLVERLKAQRATTTPPAATQQTDQLRKALELLTTMLVPGTDGKPPLGQINGALGQTLGNLLNGKKTAIGVFGAALTSILSQVPVESGLGQVLALLTPAVGLSPFAMPIFLAILAWGVLGKFEKWAQGTAPPPRPPN